MIIDLCHSSDETSPTWNLAVRAILFTCHKFANMATKIRFENLTHWQRVTWLLAIAVCFAFVSESFGTVTEKKLFKPIETRDTCFWIHAGNFIRPAHCWFSSFHSSTSWPDQRGDCWVILPRSLTSWMKLASSWNKI